MRRLIPVSLVLACFACKSAEERACARTVTLHEESAESHYAGDGKNRTKHLRDCVESLSRLRAEIKPDEGLWFGYLGCLTRAEDISAQFDCLAPLTEKQMKKIGPDLPSANQPATKANSPN